MNYYSFHIGDFASHTRGLSLMEDLAYRRILDAYYQAEGPLSGDVARLIGMRDQAEAVAYVLEAFFVSTPEGWRNKRADKEIAAFQRMRDGGAKGAGKRWEKAGDRGAIATPCPPQATPNANQEPVTNNQEPKIKSKGARTAPLVVPEWLSPEVWDKWHRYRNAGKKWTYDARALSLRTLTDLHAAGHDPMAVVDQSIERGWTGLFPIKESPNANRNTGGKLSAVEQVRAANAANAAARAAAAQYIEADYDRIC